MSGDAIMIIEADQAVPDEVIDAMAAIGRRMDERFKETARGGLAKTVWGEDRSPSQ